LVYLIEKINKESESESESRECNAYKREENLIEKRLKKRNSFLLTKKTKKALVY